MTFDGAAFGAEVVKAVRDHVDRAVRPLEQRIAQLESKQAQLRYRGIWQPDCEYQAGNFCTISGSLWYCEETTRSRPGTDSTWRLAVKQGAFNDAR
jgi:hypothetical protein